jgi:hypothetical protein
VAGAEEPTPSRARYLVGCWFALVGYLGGGMIALVVARIVGSVLGCAPPEGQLACDADKFVFVGATLGGIVLPAYIVWRLWQSGAAQRDSKRG